MFKREDYLLPTGKMRGYAFPGGYPIYYITRDNGILCPDCASLWECRQATAECPDDAQWYIVGAECNYEDSALYCDHCGKQIEPAYEE